MVNKIINKLVIAMVLLAGSTLYVPSVFCTPAQPPYQGGAYNGPVDDRMLLAKCIDRCVELCTTKNAFANYEARVKGQREIREWGDVEDLEKLVVQFRNSAPAVQSYQFDAGSPVLCNGKEYKAGAICESMVEGVSKYRYLEKDGKVYTQSLNAVTVPFIAGHPFGMRFGAVVVGASLAAVARKLIKYVYTKVRPSQKEKTKEDDKLSDKKEENTKEEKVKNTRKRVVASAVRKAHSSRPQ